MKRQEQKQTQMHRATALLLVFALILGLLPGTVLAEGENAPILSGAPQYFEWGVACDYLQGVTATSADGTTDLIGLVTWTGEIDTQIVGGYIITYSVSDEGETATLTLHHQVVDKTPPVIKGLPQIIEAGSPDPFDPRLGITAADNKDGDLTTAITVLAGDNGELDTNKPGEYPYVYKVEDASKNSYTLTLTHLVADTAPPVINGTGQHILFGSADPFNPLYGITAMDNIDGDLTAAVAATAGVNGELDANVVGSYPYLYEVMDSSNNLAKRVITHAVLDQTAPVLAGDAQILEFGATGFDPLLGVTATDNADGNLTAEITVTVGGNGVLDSNKAGVYPYTYKVTDASGNTASLTLNHRVLLPVSEEDTEPPIIEGEVQSLIVGVHTSFDPMAGIKATDDTDGDLTDYVVVTAGANGELDINTPGIYPYVYYVEDEAGNFAQLTLAHVVYGEAPEKDTTPPIIEGLPQSIEAGTENFDPMLGITATDDVDGDLTASVAWQGSIDLNTPGNYKYVYTVEDAAGNTFTLTLMHQVTKKDTEIDRTPPVITGTPQTIEAGSQTIFNALLGIAATDDVDGNLTASVVVTSGNIDLNTPGLYPYTYTVTDAAGNSATLTLNHRITEKRPDPDTTPPVITVEDRTIFLADRINPYKNASAYDEGDGADVQLYVVSTEMMRNELGQMYATETGVYTVTLGAADSKGNQAVATYNVTVIDNPDTEAPVLLVKDMVLVIGSEFDPLSVVGSVTDNMPGEIALTATANNVDTKKAGEYVVTIRAIDEAGNYTDKTARVTVIESIVPPTEGDKSVLYAANRTIIAGSSFDPLYGVVALDYLDGDITAHVKYEGSVDTNVPGNYTVKYTVENSRGNVTERSVTITVLSQQEAGDLKDPSNENEYKPLDEEITQTSDLPLMQVMKIVWPILLLAMAAIIAINTKKRQITND